jgi:hypothetical protein
MCGCSNLSYIILTHTNTRRFKMYNADLVIDMIQNSKKTMVNTFVQHEGLKDAMVKFIDAQTTVAKDATRTLTEANAEIVSQVWGAANELDWSKFASQFNTIKSKK